MAYTLLLQDDNSVIATQRQTIVQRSSLVDVLRVIVPRYYGDDRYDMKDFDLTLEYCLPVSNEVQFASLKLEDAEYKKDYLLYKMDISSRMTAECGIVKMHFSFMRNYVQEDGTAIQQVREFTPYEMTIIPLASYLTVPDAALSQISQMYLAGKSQIEALEHLAAILSQSKADNIKLDVINEQIYLTANGVPIGQPININELGNEITEKTIQGTVKINI